MTTQTEQPVGNVSATQPVRRTVAPRYAVAETPEAYVVTAYVPGSSASEIETLVEGDQLLVTARRGWTAPSEWTPVHREISQADYRFALGLDRRVNRDSIKAQLSQGVLTLTLSKAEELKPRKIEISTS